MAAASLPALRPHLCPDPLGTPSPRVPGPVPQHLPPLPLASTLPWKENSLFLLSGWCDSAGPDSPSPSPPLRATATASQPGLLRVPLGPRRVGSCGVGSSGEGSRGVQTRLAGTGWAFCVWTALGSVHESGLDSVPGNRPDHGRVPQPGSGPGGPARAHQGPRGRCSVNPWWEGRPRHRERAHVHTPVRPGAATSPNLSQAGT